jgi:hypothetical protein
VGVGLELQIPNRADAEAYAPWMWTREDAYPGIEVTFEFKGEQTVRARYVTDDT